jgi:adenosylcobinamide-GDP ribazoletransferase
MDRIWASFIFFTRLPFWRLHQPPRECYTSVVEYWPLVGWLTAGVMAGVLYVGSHIMPYPLAVLLAIAARMLLTGALHEDGLADFFDGFGGGGSDRQRILDIMKDSHIGTYGVLSVVMYVGLLFFCLFSMGPLLATFTILAVDPFAKMLSAQMVMMLPYARTEDTSKAHTVYRRMTTRAGILLALQGLLPIGIYSYFLHQVVDWQMLVFLPCLTMYFLYRLIWSRLRGYTGDCCGAMFLLVELSAYLAVLIRI